MNPSRLLRVLPPTVLRSALVVALAGLGLHLLPFISPLGQVTRLFERLSFDLPFLFRGAEPVSEVVVVYLDDISHQQLGQPYAAPWDRQLHAQLLTNLLAWQAKAIVFDIVLDEVSPRAASDAALEAALRQARDKVVLAGMFDQTDSGIRRLVLPLTRFRDACGDRWGLADLRVEPDRAVRRLFLRDVEWKDAESLAARAAQVAKGLAQSAVPSREDERWLHFYGPPGTLPHVSYFEALQSTNQTLARQFRDKVVFIGKGTVLGFSGAVQDGFRTPYSRASHANMPGVDLHATQFLNLLRGQWLERPRFSSEALLILLVGAALGGGLVLLRPWTALALALVALLGMAATAWTLAATAGVWFDWAVPCLVQAPLAAVCALAFRAQAAVLSQREREAGTVEFRAGASGSAGIPNAPHIPDHELLRLIGRGSYGEVWLARNVMGSLRAVKIVRRHGTGQDRQFEREFSGLQKFEPVSRLHEGFVDILHIGRDDAGRWFYYVMELADDAGEERSDEVIGKWDTGATSPAQSSVNPSRQHAAAYAPRTLQHELRQRAPLPLEECLRLGESLTAALDFLHSRGLVHRDLKPSNIIFVKGRPKLADIGLVAESDEAGSFVGTAGYIPPEGPVGPTSDLFSLGKVLYEAATGLPVSRFPEWPASGAAGGRQWAWEEFRAVLLRVCAPESSRRYASAVAMQEDLRGLAGSLARRPGTPAESGG